MSPHRGVLQAAANPAGPATPVESALLSERSQGIRNRRLLGDHCLQTTFARLVGVMLILSQTLVRGRAIPKILHQAQER